MVKRAFGWFFFGLFVGITASYLARAKDQPDDPKGKYDFDPAGTEALYDAFVHRARTEAFHDPFVDRARNEPYQW